MAREWGRFLVPYVCHRPLQLKLKHPPCRLLQMRMLLRRMPLRQICSGASKDEGPEDEVGRCPPSR